MVVNLPGLSKILQIKEASQNQVINWNLHNSYGLANVLKYRQLAIQIAISYYAILIATVSQLATQLCVTIIFLNQVHTDLWPALAQFLKIDSVQIVSMHVCVSTCVGVCVCVCVFVCVCVCVSIPQTINNWLCVIWHDMNPI